METEWLHSHIERAGNFLKRCWLRTIRRRIDSSIFDEALQQAEEDALAAEEDAVILECIIVSGDNADSLASRLERIRKHAEELQRHARHLGVVGALGERWQAETILIVQPLLRSLARQLEALARCPEFTNGFACPLSSIEYTRSMAEFAGRTAGLLRDFAEWGRESARSEFLQHPIILPREFRRWA